MDDDNRPPKKRRKRTKPSDDEQSWVYRELVNWYDSEEDAWESLISEQHD